MIEQYHITFLRHGESVGNANGVYQGQLDSPLNDTGRAQARRLAASWHANHATFDRIISSPLLRARETAEIIALELDVPLEFDPDLMERDGGDLQGLTPQEASLRYPSQSFQHIYMPGAGGGESEWELFLRAGRAVYSLMSRPPGRYLVVSHGAILNRLMYTVLGIMPHANFAGPRFRFENTGYAVLTYSPQSHNWMVLSINERSHLPGEAAENGIRAGIEPNGRCLDDQPETLDEGRLPGGDGHVD